MTTIVRCGLRVLAVLLCVGAASVPGAAQQEEALGSLNGRVSRLERDIGDVQGQVRTVEQDVNELQRDYDATDYGPGGLSLFFVGAFCALWAQNTGRNAWLWFFLGMFFNVITLVFLLAKNSDDRTDGRRAPLHAIG